MSDNMSDKSNKLTVLDRLKLELANKPYFTDEEYTQFLSENDLQADEEYIKNVMQRDLLQTVVDVFEAVSNDVDIMRSISTSFANIGQAYGFIQDRISQITQETDFLIGLMEDKDLFDDNGNLTANGAATITLHNTAYDTYMKQAKDYADAIEELPEGVEFTQRQYALDGRKITSSEF